MTSRADWNAARDEALAALREVRDWRLPAAGWPAVGAVVDDLGAAVAASDLAALWTTTGRLEACSPRRVRTRLGDPPPELPAPRPVLERIAELVHQLARDDDRKDDDEPRARRS
jgi:hypothetical protein